VFCKMGILGVVALAWVIVLVSIVLAGLTQLACFLVWGSIAEAVESFWTFIDALVAKRRCRKFLRGQVRAATRRVSSTYAQLMHDFYLDDVDESLADLVVAGAFTKASVLLAQQARLDLKFPKMSAANELVVADWLNKNAPDTMGTRQRARIFPLAIKLAFVKSRHELEAHTMGDWFRPQMDLAK
jgi:hypothetical protein